MNDFKNNKIAEFAGKGTVRILDDIKVEDQTESKSDHSFLGEWSSTAICGNDITSSCLYVSALAVTQSGVFAPVVLLIVGLTLFLFRKIYGEVGSALPLNGGTYTLLLNTTSKKIAAFAAGLTVLSYIATAVISSNEAIHYLKVLLPDLNSGVGVIFLLFFFAALSIYGIGESAKVALTIFSIHITTLALLATTGIIYILNDPNFLIQNFKNGLNEIDLTKSLIFGFAVSLLGISGFESSANFIEEQKQGVFPKTLKNMWLAVIVFNPLIAFLAVGMVPIENVESLGEGFLSHLGGLSLGSWFAKWIAVNAFLVLSGAVLTSFVGIQGLVRRMAMDRCMPDFLLNVNKTRGTNHWIVILFMLVCVSIYFVTSGKTQDLAGVYTLSFLFVMSFFAIGNAYLKVRRARLPRNEYAPWGYIVIALSLLIVGIAGNIYLNPKGAAIFLVYFGITTSVIMFLLLRTTLLRFFLLAIHYSASILPNSKKKIIDRILRLKENISSIPVLYFSKGDNLASLNEAVHYVLKNEQTKSLTVCHVTEDNHPSVGTLENHIKIIDEIYPKLKIDLIVAKGKFSPELINVLSKKIGIAKNRMFIGSPGGKFPHRIEHLGGVRVILSGDGL